MTGSKRSWPLRSGESGPAAASPLRARLHIQRQIRRTPDDRSFTFRRAPRSARTGKHLRPRLCGRGSRICAHAWLSDNLRIYDDLVPHLVNASWRVVTFDFLGFGQSDKPPGASYSFRQQLGDLKAVVDDLGLGKIVPVAHDSSGMATLNYALTRPDDVDSVIMLNSAYSEDSTVLWPEMITLFATRSMQPLAIAIAQSPEQFGWLLNWQQKQFQDSLPEEQKSHFNTFIGPLISENFVAQPSAGPAFVQLAAQFFDEHARNAEHLTALKTLDIPVKLIWGQYD